MSQEIILPKDEQHWLELRKQDITSTEISCLFNCSPYATKFELWHRKKKNLPTNFEANERTDWGLFLQDGIANKFAKDNKWRIKRKNEYIRNPYLRLGASFDYDVEISVPREDDNLHSDVYLGLGEVKNVDGLVFRDGWIVEDDYIEAPAHIELQVQQQMFVSGAPFNMIMALVGGNRGIWMKRLPNKKIFDAIIKRSAEFWKSIDDNIEPEPFYDVDADFISTLYNKAEDDKVFDARGNFAIAELTKEYKKFQAAESLAEKNKKSIKSRILPLIGEASKVLIDGGFSISCGVTKDVEIEAHTRSGYRRFMIYGKGEKE